MQFSNQTTTRFGFRPQIRQRTTQTAVAGDTLFASGGTRDADVRLGAYSAGTKYAGHGGHFTGETGDLKKVEFDLTKVVSTFLSGNITAVLYAGIDEGDGFYPTGAALATSGAVSANSLNATITSVPFTFSPYTMTNAADYVITINYTGGDATNYVNVAFDSADVAVGNYSYNNNGTWAADNTVSLVFRAYK